MARTYTNLLTHVVFSTKDRTPSIDPELKPRLLPYLGGILHELKGRILAINGTADHLHLLLWLSPNVSIAEALRVMKTNSSRWVHETWASRRTFGWQLGYAAFSVSQSNAQQVMRYIAHQELHHRKVSFQQELVAYLNKHGIDYDERYVWE